MATTNGSFGLSSEIRTLKNQSIIFQGDFWKHTEINPDAANYLNDGGFRFNAIYRFYIQPEKVFHGWYAEIGGILGTHEIEFKDTDERELERALCFFTLQFFKSVDPIITTIDDKGTVHGLHLGTGYQFVIEENISIDFGLALQNTRIENINANRNLLPNRLNGVNLVIRIGAGIAF
ncbi:MAG: hypothetical protein AB8G22_01950 [Saprospiraceae bacterium]